MSPPPIVVHRARTPWQRLRGLLGSALMPDGHGLLIERCAAVHTLGMNRALDVVFLDQHDTVLRVAAHLKPGRMAWCRGARRVLELEAGQAAEAGLTPGQCVVWTVFSGEHS